MPLHAKTILFVVAGIAGLALLPVSRAADYNFDSGDTFNPSGGTTENPFDFAFLSMGTNTVLVTDHHYASGREGDIFLDLFTFILTNEAVVTFTMTPTEGIGVFGLGLQHSRYAPGGNTPIASSGPMQFGTVVVTAALAPGGYELVTVGSMPATQDMTPYTNETYSGTVVISPITLNILSITHPTENSFHLQCLGTPNGTTRIESSSDPSPGTFTTLAPIQVDSTGVFQYDDTNAVPQRFYRLAYP